MRFTLRYTAVFFLTLFAAACNTKNKVNLIESNAKNEVPSLGNLTFTFDKNLAPDSVLNYWDSTVYVLFEPPIPGRFRWENANELIFSPEAELPPATSFTATVTDKILRFNKTWRLGRCETQKFSTAPLRLENTVAFWNVLEGTAANAFPQVELYFNYRVKADALKPLLTVTANDEKVAYNVLTTGAESRISLSLMNIKPEDRDVPVKITVTKGLTPEGGNTPTAESMHGTALLTSPYNLSVNNIEADHDGTIGTVKLFTSQPPVAENLDNFIAIEPTVTFKAEATAQGIVITSENFDVSKSYTLKLKKDLKGRLGGTLKEEYTNSVAFGRLEPQVSFVNRKGVYLGSKGARNIEVRITNVPKVKVIISKIYESNLLAAERFGYSPRGSYSYDDGYDYEYDGYGYGGDYVAGDVLFTKEFETKNLPRYGNSRLLSFNAEDKLRDYKGIYHIQIQSTQDYWLRDSRFISLSDIGLIAKQTRDKLVVFANSISSADALNGVDITVYGNNNQVIGNATTNAEGVAEVDVKQKDFAGFRSAMITARNGGDFNYLPFSGTRVNTSRFEVGGKRNNPTNLDAFIYAERELYRPGEKVNLSVIIRDWKWKNPGELPLKMKMLLPNGKELKTLKKTLNEQGSLETQIELSPSAVTGSYSFEVYTGNDVLLASKNILVEEFMPDRIKVTAALDKKTLAPNETVKLTADAVNFFGPPAANRNYEVEIQLHQRAFYPDKYPRFDFHITDLNTYYEKIVRQGKTNEQGRFEESYTVPAEFADNGLLEADFYTTVFDETGRPVNRKSTVEIFTQSVFYGLGNDGYYYYPLNRNISFPVIAVGKDGKALQNITAHVQVIKHDYKTVLSRSYEYFRYESQRDDKTIIDQNIVVNGENTVFNFVPRTPGQYEIRIGKPGVNRYVSNSFYSYGSWGNYSGNFEVDNEGNVDIELDKKSYYTGEKAKVLFKTPFDGKMLVTIENDRVVEHRYIDVQKRAASIELNLTEGYLPNAYVTATLIKPHTESDIPLTVAHGYQSIRVEGKDRQMPVQIIADKSVRSRTHQRVKVKAAPNAKITLAVVDEGILQVTGYKTPDPYAHFYQNRALEVISYDLYPLLFPEIKGILSSTGGDGFDLSKRTNPLQNKRVKLVSYWSGITDAAGNGEASFEFDIPQFSGELRLMAVAYRNEKFGHAETRMTVADPIVLSTALPRFLSPRDTVTMPVTVSNTTKKTASATVTLKTFSPIQIIGSSNQRVEIPANSEGRAVFKLTAAPEIKASKVVVEVNALNEKFIDETDITVRPPASLQKVTDAGAIAAGNTKAFDFAKDFIAGSSDYQLIVSKNPVVGLADQMYSLLTYPHGCTEQTVSAAFPQLYFAELADLMQLNKNIKVNANYHVQEAIRKVKMRQLYNGAITLWDNEGSENWWATAYAAHFLLEARKAGFDVEQSLLDNLHSYLINRLKNRSTTNYYYRNNTVKQLASREIAYTLYVLALAGKPQPATMNYYKQNSAQLTPDARYLLSAAYALAGDRARYKELLPTAFVADVAERETGGSFSSMLRDEAIALNAMIEVDPDNPQAGIMAKHISEELKKNSWYSTQERAFAFLALGKIAREANKSSLTATVKVNGKVIKETDGSTLRLSGKELGGNRAEISVSGTGKLYYFYQAEGISKDGSFKQEDSYLRVRKRFYDRYGRALSGSTFTQNDLVVVAITLENAYSRIIENVVITDLLPAGFEIENPRTKEIPGMDWIKNESYPTHTDIRDDRINFFVTAGGNTQTYYYAIRAVTPGSYVMGPVMADAMYNGEYHSYNGGGLIQVKER